MLENVVQARLLILYHILVNANCADEEAARDEAKGWGVIRGWVGRGNMEVGVGEGHGIWGGGGDLF